MPTVLWWGRFDAGYSRNRILRALLQGLGWEVLDFKPRISGLADLEARLRRVPRPDLVWVPCFRQRDLPAARRWSQRQGVPLIFDPLISAYDKQVEERRKLRPGSRAAQRLLAGERGLFAAADIVLADTEEHAVYFQRQLGVPKARLHIVPVGAEEALFKPCGAGAHQDHRPLHVLFYGSYIPLQGPDVIVQAARLASQAPVVWTLIGAGPLRRECETLAQGLPNVRFEDWLPYEVLPQRICGADVVLGVFGMTPKAARVIPNKVYQALACGRAVLTRSAPAYPALLRQATAAGVYWVEAGDPAALAHKVMHLAEARDELAMAHRLARTTYERYFSQAVVRDALVRALSPLGTLRAAIQPGQG